ncbi:transglutaminase family protein [Ferruginibacter albus]|uniref:transglutaminase family protein n=1 Tax=Ferruginibacter albus TaxID=2875540 RepID=UPI001CC4332B|nr:transglutaminase family protein [Ferruginibacter albus]UAY51305.1 transglutaminase family protein [Ferruginibacter albus]
MNYIVTHTTTYQYDESVGLCYNIVRLLPRNTATQLCARANIDIQPKPDVYNEYEDFFGNKLVYFAIQQEHKILTVTVRSEIQKLNNDEYLPGNISWEEVKEQLHQHKGDWLEVSQYIPYTAVTRANADILEYAARSFTVGRTMFDAVYDLMQRIFNDFIFKPGFTTIATPLSVVFKERKGVCQDFAHLAIACVRAMGLPARYISGYIETIAPEGEEKLIGVDASHAWFSVFIPGTGWVDFDPTNNQLPSMQHVTVGWGRDYFDIAPVKGVIFSVGDHNLSVAVDMRRV